MHYPTRSEIEELSPGERPRLIEDVWQTFESAPDALSFSSEHREILYERLAKLQKNPDGTIGCGEVRQKVQHKGSATP